MRIDHDLDIPEPPEPQLVACDLRRSPGRSPPAGRHVSPPTDQVLSAVAVRAAGDGEGLLRGEGAIQGVKCCHEPLEISGPLDLMADDLVSAVAAEVPDHWDDFPRLYRRLTPRIIRPAVTGRLHIDENLIASRLVAAGWTTWDAPLTTALHEV
jgi:hypothetical protein